MAIMLIGLSTGVAAWRYHVIYVNSQPGRRAQTELGKHVLKPEGDASNLETECQMLRAGYADAELELARVSAGSLQLSNAIHHYQRVLELSANSVAALSSLAWLRATASDPGLRNGGEAVRLAERVCDLTHYNTALPVTILAAAYAEAGRFNDALTMAQKARDLALTEGKTEVVARNEEFLALFKSGRAYHQEAKAVP
jgi:tetratricopeptide (TPR) repeat protein